MPIPPFYGALSGAALDFVIALHTAPVLNSGTIGSASIGFDVSFWGYVVARGVAERLIDSHRKPTPADVGQPRR